jgi:DNA-binding beta-propeller fold protein YncE
MILTFIFVLSKEKLLGGVESIRCSRPIPQTGGRTLEIPSRFCFCVFAAALLSTLALAQTREKLRLIQTIPLPGVTGRLDHMDVDVKGQRLFVAGLEKGSVEVVDLATNQWKRSIPGFRKPQGIAYIASLNKLFVASGDDATLRVFRADTLDLLDSIQLKTGPNRVAYDPRTKLLYVGYGGDDAGKEQGEIGVIDAQGDKHVDDIHVSAHPAELLLDRSGDTLYVFVSLKKEIEVIDTRSRKVKSTFPVSSQRPGDAAFDDSTHRLLLGTRIPANMIAMDSQTGKEVAKLPTAEGMDGVYFDAKRKRIYISGGRAADAGFVSIYQQLDPDHYETIAKISTRPGAGTSFFSPELDRYYVAAPSSDKQTAAILVFEPQP